MVLISWILPDDPGGITCMLPLFRSQAAIVFKISIFFTFSHVKAYVFKIDLDVK